ncbi:MAG: low-specificity L-threonine aldolase [Planctomycetia bacterium]
MLLTKRIDLRSDTVTRPSLSMRQAMALAEVGDDVMGEDETVNQLEDVVAKLLGKEAALFAPSGTMTNQIAIRVHTRPGDDLLCEAEAHIHIYEGGGPAMLSGVTCRTIPGRRGLLDVDDFTDKLRPENVHYSRTKLVCLENTHNRGGGSIHSLESVDRICDWAHGNGLATHLDGARLMNAVVATGVSAETYVRGFDTVSLCLSKGLGCPVGSILAGSADFIHEARRVRKVFGGGMRQAGVLAAAGLYALEHNVERLADDHANAQILAKALEETHGFHVLAADVQTNLMWIRFDPALGRAGDLAAQFRNRGVLVGAYSEDKIRMCTHLDVSRGEIEYVAEVIRAFAHAAV